MEIYQTFLTIIGVLMVIVIYQSRNEQLNLQMYMERFFQLIMIVINYLKDVGICAATKFREIDWNLTKSK